MRKSTLGISLLLLIGLLSSCIQNDLPYPRIPQKILELVADGESQPAYIDSLAYEVNIYLEETVDIRKVSFNEYKVSAGATSDPNLLQGTYDLSNPLFVTVSLYQDYNWEIIAHQDIERYFTVKGEVGESVIDPVGKRVIVTMPENANLSNLTLESVKLGPAGITTLSPDLKPGPIDLTYPIRVEVTCFGQTEFWTIYAELTDNIVNTTQVDPWAKVIWAYGEGPADVQNGFEYRLASDSEWIPVDPAYVTQTQGSFSCYIPHLEPLTEYVVRSVSGSNFGNEVTVRTEGTADIPDGDFEQWFKNDKDMWCPWNENGQRYWDTGNGGSITMKQNLTEPTDYTPTGSGKAARCETRFVGLGGMIGKLGSGSIFTGEYVRTDGTNGVLAFGRPFRLHPTKLKGYFQYDAKPITYTNEETVSLKNVPDSCHIYVALCDWTAPYEIRTNPKNRQLFNKNASYIVAYGELVYSGNMTAYAPFEIELNYRSTSRLPLYLQITCTASKYGDYFTGGNGSLLYVDQFYFDWDL